MTSTVAVVVPTIPPRWRLLARAVASVKAQTRPPDELIISVDEDGEGAAITRTRGLRQAATDWVAFLDDDDELGPRHLERCIQTAEETGADMVYPWFTVSGGVDPFPMHYGKPWDPAHPVSTTITVLVRTELALEVGGFEDAETLSADGRRIAGEDWRFVCRINDLGAKIVHLPERTWIYHHHMGNLSGLSWTGTPANCLT